ncbi:MAG: putative beta-lactamase [Mycobacterium sp.]|nr:putative beta-lactamase [Mycobacterium sp.]
MDGWHIEPRFAPLALKFSKLFRHPNDGGGALAVYHRGELVLDIWAGYAHRGERWQRDTVALSFSTGKGVASTLVHRLAEQGLIDYDATVATYWPEFAANGKEAITVRELMSHRAGLHKVQGIAPDGIGLLNYEQVVERLAANVPDPKRLTNPGYHGVTYGWLVAELAARAARRPFTELLRTEVAEPLGVDELWFYVPEDQRHRIAGTFPRLLPLRLSWPFVSARLTALPLTKGFAEAMMPEKFDVLVRLPEVHSAVMPGWNGVFSARALARMYAPLAGDGTIDGAPFLKPETIAEISTIQTRARDYVLGMKPNWRLGYHQAFVADRVRTPHAFGHFGLGGSGGYADPDAELAVAFISNHLGNKISPLGDLRLPRLGALARRLAVAE